MMMIMHDAQMQCSSWLRFVSACILLMGLCHSAASQPFCQCGLHRPFNRVRGLVAASHSWLMWLGATRHSAPSLPVWLNCCSVGLLRTHCAGCTLLAFPFAPGISRMGEVAGVPARRYGAAYGACVDGWGWNFVGMWWRYMARQWKCCRAVL